MIPVKTPAGGSFVTKPSVGSLVTKPSAPPSRHTLDREEEKERRRKGTVVGSTREKGGTGDAH